MEKTDDFVKAGYKVIDWLEHYFNNIEKYPVLQDVAPGDIIKQLPGFPPEKPETFDEIFSDFEKTVLPGITHWQHPGFHAYFPANNSFPSVIAELLTAGLGVQGMKWITSPGATELEKVVMKWLQQMLGLPDEFKGVIMDTASVSTLNAILAAREKVMDYSINENGFKGKVLRVYCSEEAHSSIEKAVRIAGIGANNLVKIPVDKELRMDSFILNNQIEKDLASGLFPCCIIGALGTTGTGALDPLGEIGRVARKFGIWFHIDAAYSGSGLILPEFRENVKGIEYADSFVFNPHKWLFTNFDCSAFFVRNSSDLTRTFSLVPPYLQTGHEEEIDFSNWGIQLGRRFRALKLWFVIRSFGMEGLQKKLRHHIHLGELFERYVVEDDVFELVKPRNLNIICFRYVGGDNDNLDNLNKKLLDRINKSGKVFLSHTLIDDKFVIRFVCGQTNVEKKHIDRAWNIIKEATEDLN